MPVAVCEAIWGMGYEFMPLTTAKTVIPYHMTISVCTEITEMPERTVRSVVTVIPGMEFLGCICGDFRTSVYTH